MPTGRTEIPNWILVAVVAPLVVTCLGIGGANIVTVAVLKSTVDDLKQHAVAQSYVDNRYDRLHDYIDYKIGSMRQMIKQQQAEIDTNRARAADNADRINKMMQTKNAVWSPLRVPNPTPHLTMTGAFAIHDKRRGG